MATLSAISSPSSLSAPNPNSPITNSDSDSPNPSPSLHGNAFCEKLHSPSSSLLNLTFGHDPSFFSACTDGGLRVFSCDPFAEIYRSDGGGIGAADVLLRCNLLAVVGGGPNPQFSPNKVKLWCDVQSRFIGELACRSAVLAVWIRHDLIAVAMKRKALVFSYEDLRVLHVIETAANPKGLCAVSEWRCSPVLVFLGSRGGEPGVVHHAPRRTRYIEAHESDIGCLGLTQDDRFLATASTKGTLVRVFRTADGALLQEVRRGIDRAEIHCLAFSSNSQWLAVSSDEGTVHVFSLKVASETAGSGKSGSLSGSTHALTPSIPSLSFIKGVLPKYFSSEWSVARFRLVESSKHVVAFGHMKNTVIIIGMNGSFYRCQFDPVKGGDMTQLEHHNFLNS